jgi:CRP-like cAMP-binding protein
MSSTESLTEEQHSASPSQSTPQTPPMTPTSPATNTSANSSNTASSNDEDEGDGSDTSGNINTTMSSSTSVRPALEPLMEVTEGDETDATEDGKQLGESAASLQPHSSTPRPTSATSSRSVGEFGERSSYMDKLDIAGDGNNHRCAVSAPQLHETDGHEYPNSGKSEPLNLEEGVILQLMKALGKNCFTSKYNETERRALVQEMQLQKVEEDQVVIHQGEEGDRLYITGSGTYEMIQNGVTRMQPIGAYEVVGEMAILYRCHRTATIRSKSVGTLFYIDLEHFHHVLYLCASELRKVHAEFLKSLELMQGLAESYIEKIAEVVDERTYGKGQVILDEQLDTDHFYILVEGEVLVMENNGGRRPVPITSKYPGSHFGARGLLDGQVSSRVYKSLANTARVLVLDRIAFNELIVPLEALGRLHSDDLLEDAAPTPLSENKHAKLQLQDLTTEGTLGVGGFGQVDLVGATGFDEKFAIKKLSKEHIVQNSQEEHVLNEKRVLERLNNPFCIQLLATFKDDRYVYLMMESCLGGELWLHLKKKGNFREAAARFYVASVVEGLAYIHSIGYVYRDLKPENLMLDLTGHGALVLDRKFTLDECHWSPACSLEALACV